MTKPPSEKQLTYLNRLGYTGIEPTSSRQASLAIDAMRESKDSKAAERAIRSQQKTQHKREKRALKDQLRLVKDQIRFMARANRDYGDDGLYAGFRLVEFDDEPPDDNDKPYAGAFVPLPVAQKHPDILIRTTLDYEDVLSDEMLPRGTKMVMAPGKFKTLGAGRGCLGTLFLLAGIVVTIVVYSWPF